MAPQESLMVTTRKQGRLLLVGFGMVDLEDALSELDDLGDRWYGDADDFVFEDHELEDDEFLDMLGADDDPLSLLSEGTAVTTDLSSALDMGGKLAARVNPRMQLGMDDLQSVAEQTGSTLEDVKDDWSWLSNVMDKAGWVIPAPWSWIVGGSIVAFLVAVVIARRVKSRRITRAKIVDLAFEGGIEDADEFANFTLRVSRMSADQLLATEQTLAKKLARRSSEKASERISAKLRIVAAFEAIATAEAGETTMGWAGRPVDLVASMGTALRSRGMRS